MKRKRLANNKDRFELEISKEFDDESIRKVQHAIHRMNSQSGLIGEEEEPRDEMGTE